MKRRTNTDETFSLLAVSEQMQVARETARRRFRRVGVEVGEGRRYTVAEIVLAFANHGGDLGLRHKHADGTDYTADELWRLAMNQAMEASFFDAWANMAEEAVDGVVSANLATHDEAEQVALIFYGLLAMRLAAFIMRHSTTTLALDAEPPEEVVLQVPPPIEAMARRQARFAKLLGDDSVRYRAADLFSETEAAPAE